jgi:serine/threonine protein phosphatase 1
MLTFAIGDLHGRLDLLETALAMAEERASGQFHKFVVCGDFVDRGPDSRGIIEELMAVQAVSSDRQIVVLKGNHEDMMVQYLRRGTHLHWWISSGGGATLMSYGYTNTGQVYDAIDGGGAIPAKHMAWLDALPVYHIDEHRAFVHAGFNEKLPLDEQNLQHMMWRYDGDAIEDQPNYTFEGKHVVHGHVPHIGGPVLLSDTTNLDTFAWYTGRLAVGVFDGPGGPVEILWAEGPAA